MDEAERWRRAFEAERDQHQETIRALADAVAKIGELQAMLVGAELELKAARRQAATVIELYSCAVCSCKTDRYPAHSMAHHCCGRTVLVGPCCEQAIVESPEIVQAILSDCGHAPGCKRGA